MIGTFPINPSQRFSLGLETSRACVPATALERRLVRSQAPDFGYVTDAAQKNAQERLAKLVPNEKHITNTNSGHEIHKEQPQLVISAIREVVEAVRSGRRQLTP